MHHRRIAFEETTAAREEQGVACEDDGVVRLARHHVGDRARRVARDVDRAHEQAADRERVALLEEVRLLRDPPLVARVTVDALDAQLRRDLLVPADVIVMMMGGEDRDDLHVASHPCSVLRFERAEHGLGLRGIDDGRLFRLGTDEEVGVVVGEAGDGDDAHGAHPT
jgi:hypothetical protein